MIWEFGLYVLIFISLSLALTCNEIKEQSNDKLIRVSFCQEKLGKITEL